jgi:integrase/recombinase XerD
VGRNDKEQTMTPLRQQMIDAMRQRGFAERTQSSYLWAVRDLARVHRRSPAELGIPELEQYFRHLALERALSGATCRLYRNAVRFLYLHVLQWPAFDVPLVVPKRAQRIPELLTRARPSRVPSAPVAAIREVRCRYACHADPPPCGLPSPGGRQR